uniref:Uncharacterized protein n=1 Tax=Anguilla anguilla TaxID=7936 RepID=A0A0E9VU98_ANGAN
MLHGTPNVYITDRG